MLCTSSAPISRIPTKHDAFLAISILQTHGTTLTTESRWGQKRNEAFARDVLRNQEEHRPVGMLRPFPTLLHGFEELHNFSVIVLDSSKGTSG